MEDRITDGLYLETSALDPKSYAERRVPELLSHPGVERVSWWENQRPGRKEFPRTIEEFTTLGVCELGEDFEVPGEGAQGSRQLGLHFRHTPRPAQGSLSRGPTLGLLLVLITPRHDEAAQALRDWADFDHIRHIAAAGIEGYTMITPYEEVRGGSPRYLHFYEMDSDDPEAAFQTMARHTIERRLGAPESPRHRAWLDHEELQIDYVNTFRRVGALAADR